MFPGLVQQKRRAAKSQRERLIYLLHFQLMSVQLKSGVYYTLHILLRNVQLNAYILHLLKVNS